MDNLDEIVNSQPGTILIQGIRPLFWEAPLAYRIRVADDLDPKEVLNTFLGFYKSVAETFMEIPDMFPLTKTKNRGDYFYLELGDQEHAIILNFNPVLHYIEIKSRGERGYQVLRQGFFRMQERYRVVYTEPTTVLPRERG